MLLLLLPAWQKWGFYEGESLGNATEGYELRPPTFTVRETSNT
jgi:hypothetical protein